MTQAHKMYDNVHDIELSTMDAKTVGEVNMLIPYFFKPAHCIVWVVWCGGIDN